MNQIIRATMSEETFAFIDNTATVIHVNGERFMQPASFWYKTTDEPCVFEVYVEHPIKQNKND